MERAVRLMFSILSLLIAVALAPLCRTFAASRADVLHGAAIFRAECAVCHGRDAAGGRGPDLTRGSLRRAVDDGALFRVIATGIPGSPMPGALASHSTEDVWQLVRYVRSLARASAAPATGGHAVLGQQLFDARGGCSACHRLDGRATPSGPGLGDVARQRTAEALRMMLLNPNPDAGAGWCFLRVTTQSGTFYSGRRMDEDTFSVRLLDEHGRLWNFARAAVVSIERTKTSTMPNYTSMFTRAEVDDLVAYLRTLTR